MCDPAQNTEVALLVPVLWGLRNCLHGNAPNKDRFLRAGGLETLVEVRSHRTLRQPLRLEDLALSLVPTQPLFPAPTDLVDAYVLHVATIGKSPSVHRARRFTGLDRKRNTKYTSYMTEQSFVPERPILARHPVTLQLCHASRSNGEWAVAEGVLTTLVTAALGNETMCRRLLRVGLDQLIDAAEDDNDGSSSTRRTLQETTTTGHQHVAGSTKDASQHRSKTKKKHHLPAMPGSATASVPSPRPPLTAGSPSRGPATDGELGLDQIDQIGVDGVLRQSSDALRLRMQGESRKTCSALATSLLQALGPFNYVSHSQSNQPEASVGVHLFSCYRAERERIVLNCRCS